MATLQASTSISTLFCGPRTSVSRLAAPGTTSRLPVTRRSKQVKLAPLTLAPSTPEVLVRGLVDSQADILPRMEELATCKYNEDEINERVSSLDCVSVSEFLGSANGTLERFVRENARELAIGSLALALFCLPDERALALGPEGPLLEEFWDNVRRYGFYFFTVVSGGLYSLTKPLLDLLKDPSTQILVAIAVFGTLYLVYLTVSTMLGLNDFSYEYAQ
ncbi:uncharacterized protein [Physcomitrium patens]|uniref:Uncharacterized protein ycf33 n=1 Tax=Physcomitrium patens TaxID=3218 RepID=A0A2K1K8K7_PHYPA|nr:uncharacterized protein LOC112285443 isoform X1 [Physcomitrium patens]PNR50114.1 hypothetical protein PHYPA_012011 [Physcomitrium patens]|eukprot:XP_024382049.1 uncharacterized protein LOC112285443 isoform X1 [Physcomitrella patens]